MANDRLQLQCSTCRETYTLAKYWGAGEFNLPARDSIEGQHNTRVALDSWLATHARGCLGIFGSDLDDHVDGFRLVTESTEAS